MAGGQAATALGAARPRRGTALWMGALFAAGWLVDNLAFSLKEGGVLPGSAFDLARLVVIVAVSATVLYTVYQLPSAPWIQRMMLAGAVLAILAQCADFLANSSWGGALPWLDPAAPVYGALEHAVFTLGLFGLLCATLLAVLSGETTARRLRLEGERIGERMRRHERAERALEQARDALEKTVRERTVALAEANEQLRARLVENELSKEALSARLRMERGLAACSHALLSEATPLGGGVAKALAVCRETWSCDRVWLCENRVLADGGLALGVVFDIRDGVAAHWHVPWPQVVEPFAGGLDRWREVFESGGVVTGSLAELAPEERARLAAHGFTSVLAVPLRWRDAWQGCLVLADQRRSRAWPEQDIVPLVTLAQMLGAHHELTSVDEQLRQAYGALEQRVAERTVSLTEANRQLTEEIAFRKRAELDNARLETRLRSAHKFQAIATLAAGIAHDFNNILTAITGFSELGMKRSETDARLNKYFSDIHQSGRRATELVRRLLIFSRQVDHKPVPVLLSELVTEVTGHLRRTLPAGVTLSDRVKPGPALVLADPDRMREALMMLTENGVEAVAEGGGHVEVIVDHTELQRDLQTSHGVLGPGPYVRVIVQDDGPGMDREMQERIFEPFFTTKRVGEGSGMGLSVVHGVITKHRGAIRVETNPGRGAAFQVFLPACQPGGGPGNLPGLRDSGGSEHVLVLDDEAHLVSLWEESLQRYGYRTTAFTSSLAAREAFDTDPDGFDLVLTDNVMPEMTGMELANSSL